MLRESGHVSHEYGNLQSSSGAAVEFVTVDGEVQPEAEASSLNSMVRS